MNGGHLWRTGGSAGRHLYRARASGGRHLLRGGSWTEEVSPTEQRGFLFRAWQNFPINASTSFEATVRDVQTQFANAGSNPATVNNLPTGFANLPFLCGNGSMNVTGRDPVGAIEAVLQIPYLKFSVPSAYAGGTVTGVRVVAGGLGAFIFDSGYGSQNRNVARTTEWRSSHTGYDADDPSYVRLTVSQSLVSPLSASRDSCHGSFDIDGSAFTNLIDAPYLIWYDHGVQGNFDRYVPVGEAGLSQEITLSDAAATIVNGSRTFWLVVTPGWGANDPTDCSWWWFDNPGLFALYSINNISMSFKIQ